MSFTPWREAAFLSYPSSAISSKFLSTTQSKAHQPGGMKVELADKNLEITSIENIIPSSSHSGSIDKSGDKNIKSTGYANMNNIKNKSDVPKVDSTISFDKRFILRAMQKQCSIEFLREHHLNGNEELILKKRNKESILSAYSSWMAIVAKKEDGIESEEFGTSVGTAGGSECMSSNGIVVIDDPASAMNENSSSSSSSSGSSSSSSDSSKQRLIDTFAVLYNRHNNSSNTSHSRTTVLLLHEDYPFELPVFGTKTYSTEKSSLGNLSGGLSTAANISKCGSGSDNSNSHNHTAMSSKKRDVVDKVVEHRVICVLGAVRDASDYEIMAAITGKYVRAHIICEN